MICGAILTQNTTWSNAEKALASMYAAGLQDWHALLNVEVEALADLIRSSGYYRMKARKLRAFATAVVEDAEGDLSLFFARFGDAKSLRARLLKIWGVGEETADGIVVYAAGMPSFVIDKYTMRIADRLGWQIVGVKYSDYQRVFENALPSETALFNEYHALLDYHGSRVCKVTPECNRCTLSHLCDFYKYL